MVLKDPYRHISFYPKALEMPNFMSEHEQNMSKLSRSERIRLRNQIMLMKIASGTPRQQLQDEFRISDRQIRRILQEAEQEADEWYKSLPRKRMLQIFRYNSEKIFKEILKSGVLRGRIAEKIVEELA